MELLKTGSLLGDHDLRDELQTSSTYSRNTENPAGLAPHLVPGSAFVFCAWLEMQQTWVLAAAHHCEGYMQISYTANWWTSFTERARLVQEHESYAASCLTDAANTPWKSEPQDARSYFDNCCPAPTDSPRCPRHHCHPPICGVTLAQLIPAGHIW